MLLVTGLSNSFLQMQGNTSHQEVPTELWYPLALVGKWARTKKKKKKSNQPSQQVPLEGLEENLGACERPQTFCKRKSSAVFYIVIRTGARNWWEVFRQTPWKWAAFLGKKLERASSQMTLGSQLLRGMLAGFTPALRVSLKTKEKASISTVEI